MSKLILSLLFFAFCVLSCINKKSKHTKYVTIDLDLTCTSMIYFDTLSPILLTNDRSDLGNFRRKNLKDLKYRNDRFYKNILVKNKNGHFYIDSIEKKYYEYFLVAGKIGSDLYWGLNQDIDLSEKISDTIVYKICIKPEITASKIEMY